MFCYEFCGEPCRQDFRIVGDKDIALFEKGGEVLNAQVLDARILDARVLDARILDARVLWLAFDTREQVCLFAWFFRTRCDSRLGEQEVVESDQGVCRAIFFCFILIAKRKGRRRQRAKQSLTARSPSASLCHAMSLAAKARAKKSHVSRTEARQLEIRGAFHHALWRSLTKTEISSRWLMAKAVRDAVAMRGVASRKERHPATTTPQATTLRALGAP